jgi:hypothetical protein
MKVSWHVMVKPYDLTDVHLRHRCADTTWTHAYRVESSSGKTAPFEITPGPYLH